MRISDWSSDVCSSDLCVEPTDIQVEGVTENLTIRPFAAVNFDLQRLADQVVARILLPLGDRLKQQVLDRTHARSEERRVGKECVSTCRSRWSQYHYKKKRRIHTINTKQHREKRIRSSRRRRKRQ